MLDKSKLIKAIEESNGHVSNAALILGCSEQAIYNYRNRDEDVANAITDARELFNVKLLDTAESKLLEAVQAGEWHAIKFALSTKGRHLGYTEKKEIEHSGEEVKQIIVEFNTHKDPDDPIDEYEDQQLLEAK